jgi:DNA-binding response OmpR family regulator
MKVLVVDDDVDLLNLMTYTLRREGYDVLAAIDGHQALSRWEAEHPDIVLLDGRLPRIDGFEVCRRIRQDSMTPVIMLSVRDEEGDILRGLQLGADDYLTKPFSTRQLVARIKTVLNRYRDRDRARRPTSQVQVGNVLLDLEFHEVTRDGERIQLSPREFRILSILALNAGRIIPYARLIEYAWGYYDESNSDLLKAHVSRIRKKVGLSPRGAGSIAAVLGVGYRMARG